MSHALVPGFILVTKCTTTKAKWVCISGEHSDTPCCKKKMAMEALSSAADEHAVSLHGVAHKAPMRGVPHGVDSCKLPLEDLRADPADNLSAEAMQAVMEIASVALETLAA